MIIGIKHFNLGNIHDIISDILAIINHFGSCFNNSLLCFFFSLSSYSFGFFSLLLGLCSGHSFSFFSLFLSLCNSYSFSLFSLFFLLSSLLVLDSLLFSSSHCKKFLTFCLFLSFSFSLSNLSLLFCGVYVHVRVLVCILFGRSIVGLSLSLRLSNHLRFFCSLLFCCSNGKKFLTFFYSTFLGGIVVKDVLFSCCIFVIDIFGNNLLECAGEITI